MRIVFPQDGGIYQQDIAECHTTHSVRAGFKEHQDQFIVLPCPENSPDLSQSIIYGTLSIGLFASWILTRVIYCSNRVGMAQHPSEYLEDPK
ncbi:hypothetical protein TNCV_3523711 [Trichonephila clavipes]|nr:hypothetical protein TNCV_3523711 [Trichonephila clavipes]